MTIVPPKKSLKTYFPYAICICSNPNSLKGPRSEMYHSSSWHRYMRAEADVSQVRYGTAFADGNKSVSIKENPKKYC